MNLDGKVALITGGTRGIGAATALALAGAGPMWPLSAETMMTRPGRLWSASRNWAGGAH